MSRTNVGLTSFRFFGQNRKLPASNYKFVVSNCVKENRKKGKQTNKVLEVFVFEFLELLGK